MIDHVDDSNFLIYAAKHYDNPICRDDTEFLEDLGRIKSIQRLFGRYEKTGELKERLIINHLIALYNVFENKACTNMLVHKLRPYLHYLKPFLILLSRWEDKIVGVNPPVISSDIAMDMKIVTNLRKI